MNKQLNQQQRIPTPKSTGFTLVEMVVAASIFVVISTASYAAINNVLNARERINVIHQSLTKLQRVHAFLKNDFRYAVNRPVRDSLGGFEQAFKTDIAGELFRVTSHYPSFNQTGQLKRVIWELNNNELWRKEFNTLDRGNTDEISSQRVLLDGVQALNVYYYEINDGAINKVTSWPNSATSIPVAIEVEIELVAGDGNESSDARVFRWLFAGALL